MTRVAQWSKHHPRYRPTAVATFSSEGQFRIAADAACTGTRRKRFSAKVRSLPSLFLLVSNRAMKRIASANPLSAQPAGYSIVPSGRRESIDPYITNAVKHFKFEERGKRRIHKKPAVSEVRACRPWLEVEIALIRPKIIVCLGATAAQSVFGSDYRVTKERGQFVEHPWAPQATSTIHPSAILRAPDEEQRRTEYQRFFADLKKVAAGARARV
jgi:uracil-DNA glycosylase family 4